MEPDKDAAIRDAIANTKPKELHAEVDGYDPFDHETLANEPE